MAGGKQTPRQQMIGLMYLVLLAMLAMNASKDLLNAFVFLEDGIDVTTSNFNASNQSLYTKIESAAATGSQAALQANKNSKQIAQASNQLFTKIEAFKEAIIEKGGGRDDETNMPIGKDNQDVGAEYLITAGHGAELKNALEQYKNMMVGYINEVDTAVINSINKLLATPEHVDYEGTKSPWENGISEYLPLAAVTANLTNIQSYIRNAESQMISYLYNEITVDEYKVNKIMATSIAENGYVLQGDEYSAEIFLAAADTTQQPEVIIGAFDTAIYNSTGQIKFIGETQSLPVEAGIGKLKIKTEATGNHTWGGIMKVPHPNPKRKGEFLTYPFVNNYTVAAPSAVISSKDLNIMYKGIGNKIDISAPGISSDKIEVRAAGCSVRAKGDGNYEFVPNRLGKIKIQVFAKLGEGKNQLMGEQDWIVKSFPKPLLFVGSDERPAKMKKNKLLALKGINLKYSDDFPISAKPKAIKTTYEVYDKNQNLKDKGKMHGGKWNSSQITKLRGALKPGDRVYIKTKGIGPDKRERKLSEHAIAIKR